MRTACVLLTTPLDLKILAERCLRLSPQLAIKPNEAIFIEIGKCRALYTENGFLARLQVILRKLNVEAQIAIGENITDSLAFARFQKTEIDALPLRALLDLADPFARDPNLRKSITELLSSFLDLGIKTIGEFKQIPISQLVNRFGVLGRHCFLRAHLKDHVAWPMWVPDELIFETKNFEPPVYDVLDPIFFELKFQLDQIFERLFARALKARKLKISVVCEKNSFIPEPIRHFEFEFFAPQGSSRGTLKIVRERLTRDFERKPIASPIETLSVEVTGHIKSNFGQKNMIDQKEEKLEHLSSLHNQLAEIFGIQSTYQAELLEDRRPEKSWKKVFSTPHVPCEKPVNIKGVIPERPTYLLSKPFKVDVTRNHVYIKQKRHRILQRKRSMERLSSHWFENKFKDKPEKIQNTDARNYYFFELEGGNRVTIFETDSKEFYLHGLYG